MVVQRAVAGQREGEELCDAYLHVPAAPQRHGTGRVVLLRRVEQQAHRHQGAATATTGTTTTREQRRKLHHQHRTGWTDRVLDRVHEGLVDVHDGPAQLLGQTLAHTHG